MMIDGNIIIGDTVTTLSEEQLYNNTKKIKKN